MRVLISGSSGFLGAPLCRALEARGDTVVRLVRPSTQNPPGATVSWNPDEGSLDRDALVRADPDAVVHLAGEGLAEKRWTHEQKERIRSSRVRGTTVLAEALAGLPSRPRTFVSSSAIGIYGDRGDEVLTEGSAPGTGFLAEVCKAWEAATEPAEAAGLRTIHLRTGVVLGREGGALTKMLPIFKLGLGGRIGSGKQWMSWVAHADVLGAIQYALDREAVRGALNAVAPHPVTNAEFTRALAAAVHRPALFPVPAFALRAAVGEMADEALLASARVEPRTLQTTGYDFRAPVLAPFLASLLSARRAA